MSFHQHRSSEALLSDICSAFDKLDLVNKVPAIFCEANNSISVPSLEVDPHSKHVEQNTESLGRLVCALNMDGLL